MARLEISDKLIFGSVLSSEDYPPTWYRSARPHPHSSGSLQIRHHFIGPNSKRLQDGRAEGIDERYVGRISAACDHYPADPRCVVARIECVPCAVQEDLDPGAEIHRIDDRNTDV